MARKILLADDSVAVQKAVEATLEPKDFQVFSVSKGAEAIQEASRIHPDVILLDSDLPDMDGYEICRRVKQDPDLMGIPVILMSAGGSEEEESSRAQEVGADGHLPKPFQGKDLLQRVLSLIDLTVEPTIKIDTSEMEVLDFEESGEEAEEDLELGELDLGDDGILDLTEAMEPLEKAAQEEDIGGELTFDEEGEIDLEASGAAPGPRKGIRTEELDEISFEEELEELDLGDLELEGAEEIPALEEDLGMTWEKRQITSTDEVDAGLEFDEQLSFGEADVTQDIDLLMDTGDGEEPMALRGEETIPLGASAKPAKGLVDTDESQAVSLEEDTLDLDGEVAEEIAGEELEETGIEFEEGEELTLDETREEITLAEGALASTEEEMILAEEEIGPAEEKGSLEKTVIEWEEPAASIEERTPLEATSIEWEDLGDLEEESSLDLGPEPQDAPAKEEPPPKLVFEAPVAPLAAAVAPEVRPKEPAKLVFEAPVAPLAAAVASEVRPKEPAKLVFEAPVAPLAAAVAPEVRPKEPAKLVFEAPVAPPRAAAAPEIRPKEAAPVPLGILEEVPLEEEFASIRAEAEFALGLEGLDFQEVSLDEVPPLARGLRLDLVEEDFGVVDPFSEHGIRKELARNLEDMVERILADLAPPIVERVARDIALERTEKIVLEEIERLKVHPEGP